MTNLFNYTLNSINWPKTCLYVSQEFDLLYTIIHFTPPQFIEEVILAMKIIWSIGERKFGSDFKRKIMLFNYTVKKILLYGAEI